MGTDHCILVAYGYRIPLTIWNEFRKACHLNWKDENKAFWKKRKLEPDYDENDEGSYYSESDPEQLDTECNLTDLVCSDAFHSQGVYSHDLEHLYVLISDNSLEYIHLMNRKIGGAMMGWFGENPSREPFQPFDHLQNVSSLDFSVQLEDPSSFQDWVLDDNTWHVDTQHRKTFLASLPEPVKKFLEQFPTEKYYNRWVFAYGC